MDRPYNGIPILTQWKHSAPGTRQDALDLAPTWQMKLFGWLGVYNVRDARVVKVVTKISGKRDGYIVYQTKDRCLHYRVHCIFRDSIKMNKWYPKGTRFGTIDRTPVNATGMHDHHFITLDGAPVDIVGWYKRKGIVGWFQDPLKLQPKK